MVVERYNEPTPPGALSWDVQYLDDKHRPTDKASAICFVIHEYGKHGELLREHSGFLK